MFRTRRRPCRLALVTHSHAAPVRVGQFRFRNPPLLLARVRLYPDRLHLTGWRLRGRYRRAIALTDLLKADALGGDQLLLWLADGEVLRLHVDKAPAWEAEIALQQLRLRQRDTPRTPR